MQLNLSAGARFHTKEGKTPVPTAIAVDQVKAEVARFWSAFMSKSAEIMEDMYRPDTTVFSSWAVRPEPGRLTVARRQREYFQPQASIRALTGPIEVSVLADSVAVAVYTFQLHITHADTGGGRSTESHLQNGRATQVFVQESGSKLRIVHEHLSVARE
jgi:ketosteroid isomerase-like protein